MPGRVRLWIAGAMAMIASMLVLGGVGSIEHGAGLVEGTAWSMLGVALGAAALKLAQHVIYTVRGEQW